MPGSIKESLRLLEASKWPPAVAAHPIKKAVAKRLDSRGGCFQRLEWPASLFPVECRQSPVHGRGVFTTRDVQIGELLTLYPPDGFSMNVGNNSLVRLNCDVSDAEVKVMIRRYSVGLGPEPGETLVFLLGCPRLAEDPAYLGHRANDSPHAPGLSKRQQKLAQRQVNAAIMPIASFAHMALVALQRIPAGTEVLCSYGNKYWEERAQFRDA